MPEANFLFPHFSFLIFNNNKNIDNSNSLKIILYREQVQNPQLRNPFTTHHRIKIQLTKLKMPLPKFFFSTRDMFENKNKPNFIAF